MFCPASDQEGQDSDTGGQADVIWTTCDLTWLWSELMGRELQAPSAATL